MTEIITILALIVGWSLNRLDGFFNNRSKQKEAISDSLSILLEIRFRLVVLEHVVSLLKQAGVPDSVAPMVRNLMDIIVPDSKEISENYVLSVNSLAKVDPILAYELRSKNGFSTYLSSWRKLALEHGHDESKLEEYEKVLNTVAIPEYDRLCLYLSEKISRKTKEGVRLILANELELPEELKEMVNSLKS